MLLYFLQTGNCLICGIFVPKDDMQKLIKGWIDFGHFQISYGVIQFALRNQIKVIFCYSKTGITSRLRVLLASIFLVGHEKPARLVKQKYGRT